MCHDAFIKLTVLVLVNKGLSMMDEEIQFVLYNMPEDSGNMQVVIRDETIWRTQKAMA